MNIALVTGASSGMGREAVLQIDKRYQKLDEIWVIARRKERLEELEKMCSLPIRIFAMNLYNDNDWEKLILELNILQPNVRMLVNAAGFGHLNNFCDGDLDTWESMIDLNCKHLVRMTYQVLPYMKEGARILQFASAASFIPQPGFDVYAATKSFVLSFSRALNAELMPRGISVTAVCPGPVKTEFFDVADPDKRTAFAKKVLMADPKKVVEKALNDAKHHKDVSVYGVVMNLCQVLTKLIPHRIILEFMKW